MAEALASKHPTKGVIGQNVVGKTFGFECNFTVSIFIHLSPGKKKISNCSLESDSRRIIEFCEA